MIWAAVGLDVKTPLADDMVSKGRYAVEGFLKR